MTVKTNMFFVINRVDVYIIWKDYAVNEFNSDWFGC